MLHEDLRDECGVKRVERKVERRQITDKKEPLAKAL
jgi:hypothetical protein